VHAHLTTPLVRWDALPWLFALYGGGEAQRFNEITRPDSNGSVRGSYGALSAEGGVELDASGPPPAPSPFALSFSQPSLPRVTLRVGYTHWWTRGNGVSANSGGLVITLRFALL